MLLCKQNGRRQKLRERYHTYLRANKVFAILFFLCFLLGMAVTTRFLQSSEGIDLCERFRQHWDAREAMGVWQSALWGFSALCPFLLLAMVAGITVYAPLACGLGASAGAFLIAAYLRLLLGLCVLRGELPVFFAELVGGVPVALLLLAVFAFSTAASIRIYTPRRGSDGPESSRAFGGTLFCAPYFDHTINLRFLSSYLAFFALFALSLYALCLVQTLIRTLF